MGNASSTNNPSSRKKDIPLSHSTTGLVKSSSSNTSLSDGHNTSNHGRRTSISMEPRPRERSKSPPPSAATILKAQSELEKIDKHIAGLTNLKPSEDKQGDISEALSTVGIIIAHTKSPRPKIDDELTQYIRKTAAAKLAAIYTDKNPLVRDAIDTALKDKENSLFKKDFEKRLSNLRTV